MSNLIVLHNIRQKIGKNRQPSHKDRLDEFDNAISAVSIRTPYDSDEMRRAGFAELSKISLFANGSIGKVVTTRSDYVYRIVLLHKLVSDNRDKCPFITTDPDKLDPANYVDRNSYHREFLRYLRIPPKTRRWTNLGRMFDFAMRYSNPRKFSFWTDSKFNESDPLDGAFKIGYPSDWLDELALILRCKVSQLNTSNSIRIPTVLDAFTEPIFFPVDESDKYADKGLSIDIQSSPLNFGFNEYSIDPIFVEKIEFLPVDISDLGIRAINFSKNISLWKKLEIFYNSL